jgi:hypothetical protein
MKIFLAIVLTVIGLAIILRSPETEEKSVRPLDFSRPIYTEDHAIVCPITDLSDTRADHGQAALVELFTITPPWKKKEKESELGCQELVGGLQVHAVKMDLPSQLHWIELNGTAVTLDLYLTNDDQK